MNLQESIRRILKGVAKKLSNKLHCDRHGSCVHFAELFVEEINNTHPELLKEFEVIEGYVDVKFGEGKPQEHTWIRLSDDEVIDPTFMQFTKYDKNAKYSRKRTKSYTGQEYYDKGVIESWFSKRREEQPDTVFKGGLEESIRRILREETEPISNDMGEKYYISWDENYGKSFKLVKTPYGAQSGGKWEPNLVSIVTPENTNAWYEWEELSDEKLDMWKENWDNIQKTLGNHKYNQIIRNM